MLKSQTTLFLNKTLSWVAAGRRAAVQCAYGPTRELAPPSNPARTTAYPRGRAPYQRVGVHVVFITRHIHLSLRQVLSRSGGCGRRRHINPWCSVPPMEHPACHRLWSFIVFTAILPSCMMPQPRDQRQGQRPGSVVHTLSQTRSSCRPLLALFSGWSASSSRTEPYVT